jgi:hypothetical protein
MLENPLHGLAVVGAVRRHGSPWLLPLLSLLAFALPTIGLLALRLSTATTAFCLALPLLVTPRLLRGPRPAALLTALAPRSIGLLTVRLTAAAPLPLPLTLPLTLAALSRSACITALAALTLRRAALLAVARLRLFASLLAAAGGSVLLARLGFPLLAAVLR